MLNMESIQSANSDDDTMDVDDDSLGQYSSDIGLGIRGAEDGSSEESFGSEGKDSPLPHRPAGQNLTIGTQGRALNGPRLVNLHKRRASTSPEKFNSGHFEPLTIATSVPDVKKPRLEGDTDVASSGKRLTVNTSILDMGLPTPFQITPSIINGVNSLNVNTPQDPSSRSQGNSSSSPNIKQGQSPSPKEPFSLLNKFLDRPELLILLTSHLTLTSLMSLYSISKRFHFQFNYNMASFVLASVRRLAPGAPLIFPWGCYRLYCVKDPARRRLRRLLGKELSEKLLKQGMRYVPCLKWLQMVVWREGVCQDILVQLATKGLLCPPGTLDAIKRMWFIMDIPLNLTRQSLIKNKQYITDTVLERLVFFSMRLDMRFTHPVPPVFPLNHRNQRRYPNRLAGALLSGVCLRKTLLQEKGMTPLWRVLRGWTWDPKLPQIGMSRLDMFRLYIRHYHRPAAGLPQSTKGKSILGVPWYKVGTVNMERVGVGWDRNGNIPIPKIDPSIIGNPATMDPFLFAQLDEDYRVRHPKGKRVKPLVIKNRERMLGPDMLCLFESARRRLVVPEHWVDMMLYGFCDAKGERVPLRSEEYYAQMLKGGSDSPDSADVVMYDVVIEPPD